MAWFTWFMVLVAFCGAGFVLGMRLHGEQSHNTTMMMVSKTTIAYRFRDFLV
jgi:hypothetical protein